MAPYTHCCTSPHTRLHKRLPILSFFTVAGWKERYRRFKLYITSQLALALTTRHVPNWSRKAFKQEVVDMFVDINTRLAARDMTNIMPVCDGMLLGCALVDQLCMVVANAHIHTDSKHTHVQTTTVPCANPLRCMPHPLLPHPLIPTTAGVGSHGNAAPQSNHHPIR